MKKTLIALILGLIISASNAQIPYMVKDINPGVNSSYGSPLLYAMYGYYPTKVNGVLFFVADNGINGLELWKSNGTEAGTVMIKDIRIGSYPAFPRDITNVNGVVFFTANDGTSGIELWKTDGTEDGTVMVKDIYSGIVSSEPQNLVNINGTLFFKANNGINGIELWKSDGTEAGTVMVKDINNDSRSSNPYHLTNINGTLFFVGNNGFNRGLWKSDGTEVGTVMVKDFRKRYTYSGFDPDIKNFTNVDGLLFFTSDDNIHGYELWKSDGTEAGTVMVKDIRPNHPSDPNSLTNINGTLFFQANNGANGVELWKSNGTEASTVMIKDINTGVSDSNPNNFTSLNGVLFFSANNGSHGFELWKSDGTEAGTVMVKDINAGSDTSSPHYFINVNNTLFFVANDGINGDEVWKSDGTAEGTIMLFDIKPGYDPLVYSSPNYLTNVNGKLFFTADNGINGMEIWSLNSLPSLPIILLKFSATLQPNGAALTWSTATESNNSQFIIEKSVDGKKFIQAGRIKGNGNSNTVANYTFIDTYFNHSAYYRLTQVDIDGTTTVFHDLVRYVKGLANQTTIFPNPTTDKISVKSVTSDISAKLTDLTGKILLQNKATNGTALEFSLSAYPSGIYILQYQDGNGIYSQKVVKN